MPHPHRSTMVASMDRRLGTPSGGRWLFGLTAVLIAAAGCTDDRGAGAGGCSSARDCSDGELCVAGECLASASGGCRSNADCTGGEFCDQLTRQCVAPQATPCADDDQCPLHQRCNRSSGVCVDGRRPCSDTNPCAAGLLCQTSLGECVECLDTSHCGGEACVDGRCADPTPRPDAGVSDPPDSGTSTPMPDAGSAPTCGSDSQCLPPQTVCEAGQCVLGCGRPGGLSCSATEVCNTNTGRCTPLTGPCMDDSACNGPMTVCELGQCVPGCAEFGGIQCVGGQVCDPMSGRCMMGGPICTSDAQCRPPMTVCNLNTGQCDPGCATTGCTAPATCNTSTGYCTGAGTCRDDALEENDSRAAARPISAGSQPTLGACPSDDDWYVLSLGGADNVSIDVTFQHGEGNVDVELFDPAGAVVARGTSTTDNERIAFMSTAAGDYVLHVFLAQDLGPTPGNQYGMNIQVMGPDCAPDGLEPNNTRTQASMIGPGTGIGLNVCTGDDDFYAIPVPAGQQVTVSVIPAPLEGDIDLELLGPTGNVVDRSVAIIGSEEVTYVAPTAGTYYARVYLASDRGSTPGSTYLMTVDVAPPSGSGGSMSCSDDAREQNDTAATASALATGTTGSLVSCPADDDFHGITASVGQVITVRATFTHAEGDIDIELRDASGSVVDSGLSSTDDEEVTHTAATPGPYALRVWLANDTGSTPGNSYGLQLSVAGAATCLADSLEPNQDRAGARALMPGTYPNLGICTGDDDFYAIALTAGQRLTVNARFSDAEGDVDIQLQNARGTMVASSTSVTDDEAITYDVPTTDTYYLRVFLYGDAGSNPGNVYSLEVAR